MSNKDCSKTCPIPCDKEAQKGGIIWILAGEAGRIYFFIQKPDVEITPFSIGCCCTRHAGNPKNMAHYMDAALACGQYDGLVLVGNDNTRENMKTVLSAPVQSRIIAEIARDITGLPEDSLTDIIRECASF